MQSVPETEQIPASNLGLAGGLAQGQTPVAQVGGAMTTHSSQGKEDAVGEETNIQQQQPTIPDGIPSAGGVANVGAASGQPLHEELIAKLRSELDVVQGNMRVLSEMLAYLTSPEQTAANRQPEAADVELLQQLYATCKSMQERVVELIGRLVDDEMTAELLRINDELNNLFLRYSRYTKNKVGGQQPAAASAILARTIGQQPSAVGNPLPSPHSTPSKRTGEADSLIDLSDGIDSLNTQISDMGKTQSRLSMCINQLFENLISTAKYLETALNLFDDIVKLPTAMDRRSVLAFSHCKSFRAESVLGWATAHLCLDSRSSIFFISDKSGQLKTQ